MKTIGNPLSWTAQELVRAGGALAATEEALHGAGAAPPEIRRITVDDLFRALRKGWEDFIATRSDVAVLVAIYPLTGALLYWLAGHADLLHLFLPALTGFALLGPVAAVGLYELSRRREAGERALLTDALAIHRVPAFGAVVTLGLLLLGLFLTWMTVATIVYGAVMGSAVPASLTAFLFRIVTTADGLWMLTVGGLIGLAFATAVLVLSLVSFPLLLDRDVGLPVAMATSLRVARRNPGAVALWGLIVAAGLALGALPALLGLVVVLPVLGHATWHLYRAAVVPG
ncbi:DUF2189 domain-containing protein [Acidimangrovimonas pyrenivorans]|uniref:DUF2189 domain-containing protein n=1 Tax=Acidimangrovimonas pyrenivorans TaxID=2030798 RepID=A0ABV7AJJ1_9RHOB